MPWLSTTALLLPVNKTPAQGKKTIVTINLATGKHINLLMYEIRIAAGIDSLVMSSFSGGLSELAYSQIWL